jgi:hypothetical protein
MKPRLGALLSSDDYGSSVERTATLHPLWRVLGWWTDAGWKKVEHCVVADLKRQPGMGLVSADATAA